MPTMNGSRTWHLSDNVNMVMKSDPTAGGAAKDAAQKTYMRSTQFGYGGMAPK